MFRFYAAENIILVIYASKLASFYQFYFIITLKLYHSETTLLIVHDDCNVNVCNTQTALPPSYFLSTQVIKPSLRLAELGLFFKHYGGALCAQTHLSFFVINNCHLQKHGVLTM